MTMMSPGTEYDSLSPVAIERRAKGLCGYCGHPRHNRKIGCEVCGPEVCPVTFEIDDPGAVEKIRAILGRDRL